MPRSSIILSRLRVRSTEMTDFSVLALPDGARIAYQVLGIQYQEFQKPLVLVCGMSSIRSDWERLSTSLSTKRPGEQHSIYILPACHSHESVTVLVYDHRWVSQIRTP